MTLLPTVLLRHEGAAPGEPPHHDWLIADPTRPGDPGASLWTVRVHPAWDAWPEWGVMRMTPLPPHRRRYLTWQGELTGGRGRVLRVDRGTIEPWVWTGRRAELRLRTEAFNLEVSLRREEDVWLAWAKSSASRAVPGPVGFIESCLNRAARGRAGSLG